MALEVVDDVTWCAGGRSLLVPPLLLAVGPLGSLLSQEFSVSRQGRTHLDRIKLEMGELNPDSQDDTHEGFNLLPS